VQAFSLVYPNHSFGVGDGDECHWIKVRQSDIYNKIISAGIPWFELIGLNSTPRSKSPLGLV